MASLPGDPASRYPRSAARRRNRVSRLADGARRQRGQDLPRRLRGRTWSALGMGERAAALAVYHAVWSRDLYEIATALIAMGDRAAAEPRARLPVQRPGAAGRLVPAEQQARRRAGIRRPADGRGVIPDAAGLATAARPGRPTGITSGGRRTSSSPRVRALPANAGRTPRATPRRPSRPRSLGLVVGADIARKNGDTTRAHQYLQVADSGGATCGRWTVTTNGPLSSKPYFLRITRRECRRGHEGPAFRRRAAGGPATGSRPELPRTRQARRPQPARSADRQHRASG